MKLINRLAVLPALLLLAACGSTGATGGSTDSGTVQVAMNAQNIKFDPAVITATPGQKVAVTLSNHDGFKHNFTVTELGVNQDIDPGKTLTFVVTTKGSSDLQFFCEYHKAKGMVGTLNLSGTAPAPAASAPAGSGSASPYSGY
jgi:plastocyanin